jgi:beta-phosphoglucomutase-like phosphatase (HAD superfamily)
VVIFDCNGVLVDSEPIASVVLASAFSRVGITLAPEIVARHFMDAGPRTFLPPSKNKRSEVCRPTSPRLSRLRRYGASAPNFSPFLTPPMH